MSITASVELSKDSQRNVVSYLQHVFQKFGITVARDRYELVDKAIQLESVQRREKVKSYFDDIEQPLIEGPISAVTNFLIDTFITSPSIFEVVTDKTELSPVAKQMNLINMENSKSTEWARELILYFRDLPKYNVGGLEVSWRQHRTAEAINDTANLRTGAAVSVNQREGNELKRLNMYNTFYDTTVDLNKVHKEGEYCGYIEEMSMVKLHRYIADLKSVQGTHVMNVDDDLWVTGGSTSRQYYNPEVTPDLEIDKKQSTMAQFFGQTPKTSNKLDRTINYTYEVVTLYARIIPKMFGIKVPDAKNVQIWKFVIVNWDKVIYAEKQTNIHDNLPTVLTQIDEQGIKSQVKSKAEKLIPTQNLSTKLYDLRIAGLVRGISDRLLYDKNRIAKSDIDNDNPKAKIPVKPDILNGGIQNAVQRLEYSDTMGPSFLQEMQFLDQRANKQAGLNNPQQGQLQRGNRTLGEFNEVMANADADFRTWGKLVETVAMQPVKTMIKTNILQFQPSISIPDPATGERVQIDPSSIRTAMMDFKVADGLITRDMLLDLPTARTAMELIIQIPALQQRYGAALPQLVERIFSSIGFDLSQFGAIANEVQQQQPQPQQAAGAGNEQ